MRLLAAQEALPFCVVANLLGAEACTGGGGFDGFVVGGDRVFFEVIVEVLFFFGHRDGREVPGRYGLITRTA